jgi:hypothetical protein
MNKKRLNPPPDGRKVRRPWETVGMSRASWYRYGKPTEKPGAMGEWFRREELKYWRSRRTVERVNRIMRLDLEISLAVLNGHIKPATAERLLLSRPIVIGSDGVARLPTTPAPAPDDE